MSIWTINLKYRAEFKKIMHSLQPADILSSKHVGNYFINLTQWMHGFKLILCILILATAARKWNIYDDCSIWNDCRFNSHWENHSCLLDLWSVPIALVHDFFRDNLWKWSGVHSIFKAGVSIRHNMCNCRYRMALASWPIQQSFEE